MVVGGKIPKPNRAADRHTGVLVWNNLPDNDRNPLPFCCRAVQIAFCTVPFGPVLISRYGA